MNTISGFRKKKYNKVIITIKMNDKNKMNS